MKSPALKEFFLILTFFCLLVLPELWGQVLEYPYEQGFESGFVTGKEVEFLPEWWGNEVKSSSSRIYRAGATLANSGQGALAIVPTGTFSGELKLHFDATQLEAGEISFWVRGGRNRSGTRPAVMSIAFSADSGRTYTAEQLVGAPFLHEDTAYQQYHFPLPNEVAGNPHSFLRIRVAKGEGGEGATARVSIDDLEIRSRPLAFRLISAEALSQEKIQLSFNRDLNRETSLDVQQYHINQGVKVLNAALGEGEERGVVLSISPLEPGLAYTITIGEVFDVDGNSAAGQQLNLIYKDQYELQVFDLLISEIHPAPNEQTLLPNVEWVEVFNASDRTLALEGVRFSDESRGASLPAYYLRAGEYLLLCAAEEVSQLMPYGSVLGLSSWPSLNNSGDIISLYSPAGHLLDRVGYEQSWYRSSEKHKGGWSLERIDLLNPCLGAINWSAAVATPGGTPGQQNSSASVKPDLMGPRLLQAYSTDSFTIQLVFNEMADTTHLAPANFLINPHVPVSAVQPHPAHGERLILIIEQAMDKEEKYSVKALDLRDCSGNMLQPEFSQAPIFFPVLPGPGELRINEVMYDPLSNNEEWVEIANAGGNYLNLRNCQLGTYEQGVKSIAVISRDDLIMPPGAFLVFTSNPEAVKSAFPAAPMERIVEVRGIVNLPNTGDSVAIIDENGMVQDLFGYYKGLHSPFLSDTKGISLERISLKAATNASGNWASASEASGFGTPAKQNSQGYEGEPQQENKMVVKPGVIIPEGFGQANFATISFVSKRPGLRLSLRILDTQGREVRQLAANQLMGMDSFFTWDGTDESRRLVKSGYYIVFMKVYDATGYLQEFSEVVVVGNNY